MSTASAESGLRGALDRRVLFVGGKGGVGKTTIAAALAIAAARRGRRCLVVSTDPAHSLGDVFDTHIGSGERQLAERLWGLEIDPDQEAERHISAVKLQMKGLVHPRMYEAVDRQLDQARLAPGTMEAALLERMAELMAAAGHRYDLVVFDTAPSGHTLQLLSLPEIMMAWTDGLLRHEQRSADLSAALQQFGGGSHRDELSLIGEPQPYADGSRAAKLKDLLTSRQAKFRLARALLVDSTATAFVLVLNPDKLSILESQKALASLARVQLTVAAVVVNRVLPDDADGAFVEARRRQEAPFRLMIEREFAHLPRTMLPFLTDDLQGLDALSRIGEALTGGVTWRTS